MTRSVRFHPLAEIELREASEYYAHAGPGLQEAFMGEVERCYRILVEYPEMGARTSGKVRKLSIDRSIPVCPVLSCLRRLHSYPRSRASAAKTVVLEKARVMHPVIRPEPIKPMVPTALTPLITDLLPSRRRQTGRPLERRPLLGQRLLRERRDGQRVAHPFVSIANNPRRGASQHPRSVVDHDLTGRASRGAGVDPS